jgi:hypothetical protein
MSVQHSPVAETSDIRPAARQDIDNDMPMLTCTEDQYDSMSRVFHVTDTSPLPLMNKADEDVKATSRICKTVRGVDFTSRLYKRLLENTPTNVKYLAKRQLFASDENLICLDLSPVSSSPDTWSMRLQRNRGLME